VSKDGVGYYALPGDSPEGGSGENSETAIRYPKSCRPRLLGFIRELDAEPKVAQKAPHAIVIGNEKGSGKTTIAMHVAVALLKEVGRKSE
jgi:ATPase MipZ